MTPRAACLSKFPPCRRIAARLVRPGTTLAVAF